MEDDALRRMIQRRADGDGLLGGCEAETRFFLASYAGVPRCAHTTHTQGAGHAILTLRVWWTSRWRCGVSIG